MGNCVPAGDTLRCRSDIRRRLNRPRAKCRAIRLHVFAERLLSLCVVDALRGALGFEFALEGGRFRRCVFIAKLLELRAELIDLAGQSIGGCAALRRGLASSIALTPYAPDLRLRRATLIGLGGAAAGYRRHR